MDRKNVASEFRVAMNEVKPVGQQHGAQVKAAASCAVAVAAVGVAKAAGYIGSFAKSFWQS